MAKVVTGYSWSNEQITPALLNQMWTSSTFNSSAVDDSTTALSGGAVIVKDAGIVAAKLASNSVTTVKILDDNVTTAKILDDNVTFAKLADVIDSDTMTGASATKLATSESIKAYVDSKHPAITATGNDNYVLNNITASGSADIGGLIMKFGRFELTSDDDVSLTFPTAFPNACMYMHVLKTRATGLTDGVGQSIPVTAMSTTAFTVNRNDSVDGAAVVSFLAIGR